MEIRISSLAQQETTAQRIARLRETSAQEGALALRIAIDCWADASPWGVPPGALVLIGSTGAGRDVVRLFVDDERSLWCSRGDARPIRTGDVMAVRCVGSALCHALVRSLGAVARRMGGAK